MKVLVTGFDPFGGETVNPAFEAVKLLADQIAGAEIIKLEVPTVFSKSEKVIAEAIKTYTPDVVISVGQAGGRSCVTIEQVAINLAEARIPDNDGEQPQGEKLKEDGENAYFTSLPIHAAVERVRKAWLPCHISYTAGTYVCNAVMYNVLYMAEREYPGVRAGFVHVPFICEQVVDKPNGTPSMALQDIVRSLTCIIEASVLHTEDVASLGSGTTE